MTNSKGAAADDNARWLREISGDGTSDHFIGGAGKRARGRSDSQWCQVSPNSPEFTSAVQLEGWSHQSFWGLEDGRFYLTLWRDGTPVGADPDLWISVGDRNHELAWPASVALILVEKLGVAPVSAAAALQILDPEPNTPPAQDIFLIAHNELAALDSALSDCRKAPDEFTNGEVAAYSWVLGVVPNAPASHYVYQSRPEYREISAEWTIVQGEIYRTEPDARTYLAGVDWAITKLMLAMKTPDSQDDVETRWGTGPIDWLESQPPRREEDFNVTANFRNEIGPALESATDVLRNFDSSTIKTLPPNAQFTYALAEATVAIGYSLLKIAEFKEQEADARQRDHPA